MPTARAGDRYTKIQMVSYTSLLLPLTLYLALLFLAMGVDRNIPWGHPATPEVVLLINADTPSTSPATHGVPTP